VKDSLSLAANYNLANTLYRQGDYAQAQQFLDKMKEVAPESSSAADYYFNLGDVSIAMQDWQGAVEAFGKSLLINPGDLQAKENYIYARKKLQDQQQNQQNQQNQNDQNQDQQNDQNQNDQNQDQQNNQDDQNQDKKDDGDDKQDQNGQDQNKQDQPQQGQQPKISPQAAQQMLQAIQAKEKETQDKVNKQKAEALKSRQKEKNW
jgi:tetratricopeptide (TPR) repeat protein